MDGWREGGREGGREREGWMDGWMDGWMEGGRERGRQGDMSGDVTWRATEQEEEIGRVNSTGGGRCCICARTHTDIETYKHTDTKRTFERKTQAHACQSAAPTQN